MELRDYIQMYWNILKPADDYTMDIYGLNVAEHLVEDMSMQNYDDLLELIKKKRENLLGMEVKVNDKNKQ